MAGGDDGAGYSRAFQNFVRSDDDVVGLLAYALFKRGVLEEAERGRRSLGRDRDPPPTVVEAYRQAAEQRVSAVVAAALEDARPELQQSAYLDAVARSSSELREHVTARTDVKSALAVNMVAWIITLALTALIVWTIGQPDPVSTLLGRAPAPPAASTERPSLP